MPQTSSIYDVGLVNKSGVAMEFSEINNPENRVRSFDDGAVGKRRFLRPKNSVFVDTQNGVCDTWFLDDLYYSSPLLNQDVNADEFVLSDKYDLLSWLTVRISDSPCASAMLNEAMDNGWSLGLESLGHGSSTDPDFHLDVPEKRIILDNSGMLISALGRSEYFRNMLLVSFVRALRDVWQEKRHGGFDEDYGPEAILTLSRVRAADLDVIAVLVAWELRGENFTSLWRHLIGSEDGDLAMRFSGYLERDPSASFTGKALAAAFTQWFRDESRVARSDHETLNELDSIIEEGAEREDLFGHSPLKALGVEVLSCLPDKTAYLQGMGRDILCDPLYSGLHDVVNQAHFMQVLYDMEVTRVNDVPFRDATLARKIFPTEN